uniref:UDP-glucose 6-dehydrogenase n=1 Tax=Candidatus Kentrum sp. MB TaxID=2138164 RepID=A0A450XRK5_9GAMM|nr:MAG: UDP-glucose dehydrogenase [Candidatus Kentron sp. MB]
MNITIIGTGYVGLVSGACFAEFGANITCLDLDEHKLDLLNQGRIPIYEPGLQQLVSRNIRAERLHFSRDFSVPVGAADMVFITVGTQARDDGFVDLSHVHEAARMLAPYLSEYTVVVNKSTAPMGTVRRLHQIIRTTNPKADFDIASNPEFLREGAAIADFMRPDRVVIGVENARAQTLLRALYEPLASTGIPILATNPETAELIKYACNAFLAAKIGFINEMSALCEAVGADVRQVAQGMGLDRRIGPEFLRAGPGYGGACFPKDTMALTRIAREYHTPCRITEAVVEANTTQKRRMIEKIRQALGGSEAGKQLGVLGLTFKPETDDMRQAPALTILPALRERGARIRAHDPQGMREAMKVLPKGIHYCEGIRETLAGVDALILLTEWNIYCDLDVDWVFNLMKGNVFIDLRNIYEPNRMKKAGFDYFCVG